eukprot:5482220-Heterocapsa_arctica.AAC.1
METGCASRRARSKSAGRSSLLLSCASREKQTDRVSRDRQQAIHSKLCAFLREHDNNKAYVGLRRMQ